MRVLIVRLSAMGDIVHTLPAITDASRARPDVTFDWLVDEAFADLPRLHPAIERVIPAAFKRYKKDWRSAFSSGEVGVFLNELRREKYDLVIDAQGLFKSAFAALLARGTRAGYIGRDVHEWGAHLTYAKRFAAPETQHLVTQIRQLLSSALEYEFDASVVDHGIDRSRLPSVERFADPPYLVFIHSTAWPSKNWPIDHWRRLIALARDNGYKIVMPWGSEKERLKSQELAGDDTGIVLLPQMSIAEKAAVIAQASGSVGLDTGLSHISGALGVPSVTVYGPTDPRLVGSLGANQRHVVADFRCLFCHKEKCRLDGVTRDQPVCLDTVSGESVWEELSALLANAA
ncbi:MAG TPA: lipopolysaccharide heptosyltransferase I [Pyrinomonadaceae bacterium]|nr:lipopolysaccharide heptosyltransferase I [Pyrinomonadaceae bacterium]